jgi:hypothetical protein
MVFIFLLEEKMNEKTVNSSKFFQTLEEIKTVHESLLKGINLNKKKKLMKESKKKRRKVMK